MALNISELKFECDNKDSYVKVWAKCETTDDLDDLIAWLQLAKTTMMKWDRIRSRKPKPEQSSNRTEVK